MKCDYCNIDLDYIVEPKRQFTLIEELLRKILGKKHYYLKCSKCGRLYCSKCGLIFEPKKRI